MIAVSFIYCSKSKKLENSLNKSISNESLDQESIKESLRKSPAFSSEPKLYKKFKNQEKEGIKIEQIKEKEDSEDGEIIISDEDIKKIDRIMNNGYERKDIQENEFTGSSMELYYDIKNAQINEKEDSEDEEIIISDEDIKKIDRIMNNGYERKDIQENEFTGSSMEFAHYIKNLEIEQERLQEFNLLNFNQSNLMHLQQELNLYIETQQGGRINDQTL